MLSFLTVEKYRGFERYSMKNLARVNLLTGKNNCGKTALLEAVHFLARGGDPTILLDSAWRRGEVHHFESRDYYRRDPYAAYPELRHLFFGHRFAPGVKLQVSGGDPPVDVVMQVVETEEARTFGEDDSIRPSAVPPSTLAVRFDGARVPFGDKPVPASTEGVVDPRKWPRYPRDASSSTNGTKPAQFLSPDSIDTSSMAETWERVVTEKREGEVIEAMKIVSPDIADIVFLSQEYAYRRDARTGVLVGFRGARRREPLGSHGDGMRRMLALSLALVQSEGGVLLADEIDTGLHYSIMAEMWHLVVRTAQRAGVQVFATTHSLDCVRGLAQVCEQHPDLRDEISLQKIDANLEEAVALGADEIMIAADQGVEVR